MYKNVAKRALAAALAFCMAGSMPDYSLLAAAADKTAAIERKQTMEEAVGDLPDAETETELETEQDSEAEAVPEEENKTDEGTQSQEMNKTEQEPSFYAVRKQTDEGISPAADLVSLQDNAVTKPPTTGDNQLPNQIRSNFDATTPNAFVSHEILGLEIRHGETLLRQKTQEASGTGDYTVRSTVSSDQKTAEIVVEGVESSGYTGTLRYTIKLGKDIAASDISVSTQWQNYPKNTTSFTYEGRAIEPETTVTDSSSATPLLEENTHYTVQYLKNTNVADSALGESGILITGIGSYAGTKRISLSISPEGLDNLFEISLYETEVPYNKQAAEDKINSGGVGIVPGFYVTNAKTGAKVYDSRTNTENESGDFIFETSGNDQAATTAKATIKLKPGDSGNCTGERVSNAYKVITVDIGNASQITTAQVVGDFVYTGGQIKPGENNPDEILVKQGDAILEPNVDYEITGYGTNENVGSGQVTIRGLGNYTGSRTLTFQIAAFNLAAIPDSNIQGITDKEYTGSPIEQDGLRGGTLTPVTGRPLSEGEGKDYTVSYLNNVRAGEATVLFTANPNSNCTGVKRMPFRIIKSMDTFADDFEISFETVEYTGAEITSLPITIKDNGKPSSKTLTDADFTLEFDAAACVDVGTHPVKVKGKGFYTGEIEAEFYVAPRNMSRVRAEYKIPAPNDSYTFTGTAIKPEIVIYGVTASGVRVELPTAMTELDIKYVKKGTSDDTCINAGDYEIQIKPQSSNPNYEGDPIVLTYKILPKKLIFDKNLYTIELDSYSFEYTGSDIEPQVTIRDIKRGYDLKGAKAGEETADTDFTMTYSNNRNAGTASVKIRGIGNYEGTVERTFEIVRKDISSASVQIVLKPNQEYVYTGNPIAPVLESLTVDGRAWSGSDIYRDFDIVSDHTDVGTGYTFKIVGKRGYMGEYVSTGSTFDIVAKDISDTTNVHVAPIPNQAYDNGNAVEPKPVITYNGKRLEEGEDFEIVGYANNTEKHQEGDAAPAPTVTIRGLNNFSGTREATFHICDSILDVVVEGLDDYQTNYTSAECRPKPTAVSLDGTPLIEGLHYEVAWENNINAGSLDSDEPPKVLIRGIHEYGGTKEIPFVISPVDIATGINPAFLDLNTTLFSAVMGTTIPFTGSPVRPSSLIITYKPQATDPETGQRIEYQMEPDKDFTIESVEHVNAGSSRHWLRIMGQGNFTSINWVRVKEYTIQPKSLGSEDISVIGLEDLDTTQRPVDISGLKFIDTRRDVAGGFVESGGTYELKPYDASSKNGDYSIMTVGLDRPGTAKIIITGYNNYNGSKDITFEITGSLADARVEFTDSTVGAVNSGEYRFTGNAIIPKFKVFCGTDEKGDEIELRKGIDYDYAFAGKINQGDYQFTLSGKGAYGGTSIPVNFKIKPVSLNDAAINVSMAQSVDYDEGKNVWPLPTIMLGRYELKEGRDYTLLPEDECSVPSNRSGKKYRLLIQSIAGGNFSDSRAEYYTIGEKLDVKMTFISGVDSKNETVYNGRPQTPLLEVRNKAGALLEKGTDYDIAYSDNINAGTVTVTVYGLGDPAYAGTREQYYGTAKTSFTITKMSLANKNKIEIAPVDPIIYTANPILPEPEVTWKGNAEDGGDETLKLGEDFQYRFGQNTNVATGGTVTIEPVTIDGKSNFSESQTLSFEILPKNLEQEGADGEHTYQPAVDVTVEPVPDQTYIADAINPPLDIHWGEDSFTQVSLSSGDYELVKYEEGNVEVGPVKMTVRGVGNYKGELTIPFNIVKVNLDHITIEYPTQEQYTGGQIKPEVVMTYESPYKTEPVRMTPELWGYAVTYGSNEMIGTRQGRITITANPGGNCEGGPIDLYFDIVPRDINDMEHIIIEPDPRSPEGLPTQYYDPANGPCEIDFKIRFIYNGYEYNLVKDKDYTIQYTDNDKYGDATVKLEGIGNFGNTIEKTFKIRKWLADFINADKVSVDDATLEFNGQARYPAINLNDAFVSERLVEGTDFEIVWDDDCVNAGVHIGKIQGIGTYDGEIPLEFTIRQRDINNVTFTIEEEPYIGSKITPTITGMDERIQLPYEEDDCEIVMEGEAIEPGEYKITVTPSETSNYKGTANATFSIVKANLEDESYISSPAIGLQAYTGSAIIPEIEITDTRRNKFGTEFLEGDVETYILQEGEDYTIDIPEGTNIYPGTVTVTITGTKHYEGTLTKMFDISADLSQAVIAPIPAQRYTGEKVEPKLTVTLGDKTLEEGKDFRVEYENNVERGRATATIYPMEVSLYTGSQSAEFDISRDLKGATIVLIGSSFTYTGNVIQPAAAVVFDGLTLIPGEDYEIRYENNLNVGTAKVVVTGIGGYDGGGSTTFEIIKRSVTRCGFENITDKIYAGAPTTQDVVVTDGGKKLKLKQDYEISYSDNGTPGVATVTISGIGNYGGIKTIRYLNNLADVASVSAKGAGNYVDLQWSAVPGAKGYAIYDANNQVIAKTTGLSYRNKNLDAMTTYTYRVRPYASSGESTYYGGFSKAVQAKTSIAKPAVKLKAKKKKITISWNRIGGVDGYEIFRSLKKSSGYKKIKTAKKAVITSYTNKKLVKKKKYYYKVRAYKKVNGKKVYSSYSSPKSVKAK